MANMFSYLTALEQGEPLITNHQMGKGGRSEIG